MPTSKLSNIHNNLDGYNQLVQLYEEHKDDIFFRSTSPEVECISQPKSP